jgi:hypothetical protein
MMEVIARSLWWAVAISANTKTTNDDQANTYINVPYRQDWVATHDLQIDHLSSTLAVFAQLVVP